MDAPPAPPQGSRRKALTDALAAGAMVAGGLPAASAAVTLAARPAAFEAGPNSALIWISAKAPGKVIVQVREASGWRAAADVVLTRRTDLTASVLLDGLAADAEIVYRVVDETGSELASAGRFRTAATAPRPFRFAFSADMDEAYRPFRLFDEIARRRPEFFLHLGDTVYADLPRREFAPSIAFYRRKHFAVREDPHLQRFLAGHTCYAVADDHEVDNNCNSTHPHLAQGMQVFREYWPVRTPPVLYRHVQWAGVDVVLLDTRSFRSPQTAPDDATKTMLGVAQKQWLFETLRASDAPLRFIVTSVPFHGGGPDTWGVYRTEQREIVAWLRQHRPRGTIFLTGDYHLARDWSNRQTGLHEFMAGPIASFHAYQHTPAARARYESLPGFHYGDGPNFGLVHVEPARAQARVEFIDAGGKVLSVIEVQG